MKPYEEMTFQELAAVPPGTTVYECDYGILKGAILRNPSLCAYIGVPKWHKLSGVHYGEGHMLDGGNEHTVDIDQIIDVHGGVTFSSELKGGDEHWWFGWDYGHWQDATFYRYDPNPVVSAAFERLHDMTYEHGWTVPEVKKELEAAMQQMTEWMARDVA